jgi:hypothetical protein
MCLDFWFTPWFIVCVWFLGSYDYFGLHLGLRLGIVGGYCLVLCPFLLGEYCLVLDFLDSLLSNAMQYHKKRGD